MTDLLALRNLFQLDRDGNHVENDLDTASPAKAAMTPAQLGVQPAPAPAPGGGAGGRSKSDTPAGPAALRVVEMPLQHLSGLGSPCW
eukprot:m.31599 g.31599  ORF g.31599 m.31599 type:complete len:87 (+) comp5381_c0_seq2:98-358(+)